MPCWRRPGPLANRAVRPLSAPGTKSGPYGTDTDSVAGFAPGGHSIAIPEPATLSLLALAAWLPLQRSHDAIAIAEPSTRLPRFDTPT